MIPVIYRWAVMPHRKKVTCPLRGNWCCPHGDRDLFELYCRTNEAESHVIPHPIEG